MGKKIGIADTMFARVDMFAIAKAAIEDTGAKVSIERYTVPGVKDLPVACKKLLEEYDCDIALALGMPGPEVIDKQCAHEASMGIIQAQLLTNKHILEIFVHLDEASGDKDLYDLTSNRTYAHAVNAVALLDGKEKLSRKAGHGVRQGRKSVGGVED